MKDFETVPNFLYKKQSANRAKVRDEIYNLQ